MFKGVNVPENSLVVREAIGDDSDGADNDTLMCVTDYTPCCTAENENGWYWDVINGRLPTSSGNFRMSRGNQVVRLHQPSNATGEGIFWCRIRVAADTFQDLYVGVYGSTAVNDPQGNGESVNVTVKYYLSDFGILLCNLLIGGNL